MIKLLTFILVCSIGLFLQREKPKQIKEYFSGRSRYWNHVLKLYDNSGYSYSEWAHTGYSMRDTGNYKLTGDRIKLNSLESIVKERHFGNKKRQEEIEKKYRDFKQFKNKSFKVDKGVILIKGRKKLKTAIDSMEFFMTNLFEVELKKE